MIIIIICVVRLNLLIEKLMIRAEELLKKDQFKIEFTHVNSALTICVYTLTSRKPYIVHIEHFIKASKAVADVLIKYKKKNKLLSFYLWVRSILANEFNKNTAGIGLKIYCQFEVVSLEEKINIICQKISNNTVVPFFNKLIHTGNW